MPSAADLVRTFVIDFDGTVCPTDVSEGLLQEFGDPTWAAIDEEFQRGEIGSRECLIRQGALLPTGRRSDLLRHATAAYPLQPSFAPFVRWAGRRGIEVVVASDGFGFYIPTMLEAAGVTGVRVVANRSDLDPPRPAFSFPNAHPSCVTCGVCKMLVVEQARTRGPVAFVGEGHTDRYGALYADVVFAKDALVELCRADRIPALRWQTFDDVRAALEGRDDLPGPVSPPTCPGWFVPSAGQSRSAAARVLPSQLS